MNDPLVSIIIATYNCSHLLKFAILSVLDSDYTNWELIIVGDCCTDNSSDIVASFKDERLTFINLPENSGQQAKPNNVGISIAKGKYVAFLNQDDLFFANHISLCVKHMENNDTEMLCVPSIRVFPCNNLNDLNNNNYDAQIKGAHPNGKFSPFVFNVASSWFLRKMIIEKVGPWKAERTLFVTPSQEWIFRAWKKGINIKFLNKIGLIIINSSNRPNFYKQKLSVDHEYFYKNLNDPLFKLALFEKAGIFSSKKSMQISFHNHFRNFLKALVNPIHWLLQILWIHPLSLNFFLHFGRKGKLISNIRKKQGLIED